MSSGLEVDLGRYNNRAYTCGRGLAWQVLWFIVGSPLLRSSILPWSRFRTVLLKAFGASIGSSVVIKPSVRVKYPWRLCIGDNSWIGESVWIDNLGEVNIGSNVCVSQGVYICCGSHSASDRAFELKVKPINIENGVWICAKAVVLQGVTIARHAVVSAGCVVSRDVVEASVVGGVPMEVLRNRVISRDTSSPPGAAT